MPSLMLLLACSPPAPVPDLAPDPGRDGLDGRLGPYGVAHATFRAPARVSEVVPYDVSWPALADGTLDPSGAPYPVAAFVPGGLVDPPRYRWIATHLASRGYVVLQPYSVLELAIFESDNASLALEDARWRAERPGGVLSGGLSPAPAYAMGHSLGGVVAAFRWTADPDAFEGLAVLASWAAAGTPIEEQGGRPSLVLIGSEDRSGAATATAWEEHQRFPDPTWFGIIDGMNHYDWLDLPRDGSLLADGVSLRPPEETRIDALRVMDAWLDANMRDDPVAAARLAARDFPHISEAP